MAKRRNQQPLPTRTQPPRSTRVAREFTEQQLLESEQAALSRADQIDKQNQTAAMAKAKKTTVNTSTYNDLMKKAAAAEQRTKEAQALEAKLAAMKAELDAAKASGGTVSVSKKSSKVKKEDLSQDLVIHVTAVAKTVLFRCVKFIEDELDEKEVTEEIIPFLPIDIGMPKAKFCELYSGVVYDTIKQARSDVQSNGKKRAKGMHFLYDLLKCYKYFAILHESFVNNGYFCFNYTELWVMQDQQLPTTEDIVNILQSRPAELEKPENAKAKQVLIWYIDRWLPIVHGSEYWDEKYRHYQLQTDVIPFRDGVSRELCTVESEAFGLLCYDNCRDKWQNIFDLKKDNEGKFCMGSGYPGV